MVIVSLTLNWPSGCAITTCMSGPNSARTCRHAPHGDTNVGLFLESIQRQVTQSHDNSTACSRDNSNCSELSVALTDGLDDGRPLSTQGQRVHRILHVATSPEQEDIMIC